MYFLSIFIYWNFDVALSLSYYDTLNSTIWLDRCFFFLSIIFHNKSLVRYLISLTLLLFVQTILILHTFNRIENNFFFHRFFQLTNFLLFLFTLFICFLLRLLKRFFFLTLIFVLMMFWAHFEFNHKLNIKQRLMLSHNFRIVFIVFTTTTFAVNQLWFDEIWCFNKLISEMKVKRTQLN